MSQKKGEGSFVVRKNGRLEYKFCYEDEYGLRKRKSISGGSREECLRRAEDWLKKYKASIKPLDETSTITDILYRRAENDYKTNQIGEGTLRSKRNLIKIIENYGIGNLPIAMIGIQEIDDFGISVKHYSNGVIEALYQCLKTAFAIAEEEGIISYRATIFIFPKNMQKSKNRAERAARVKAHLCYQMYRSRSTACCIEEMAGP